MKIRAAIPDDYSVIEDAVIDAAEEIGRPESAGTIMQCLTIAMKTGQFIPLLVDGGGTLCGFCIWVQLPGRDDGRVEGCGTWVAAPHRLMGWSGKLRQEALRRIRRSGGKYIVGEANADDIAACRSCEKMGFRPEAIRYRMEVR